MAVLLSYLATEIVVPVCAVVGILFSLVQWYLVSRVRVTPDRNAPPAGTNNTKKNGFNDYLIEEEEGLTDQNVVAKCAEIQNAISEGRVQDLVLDNYPIIINLLRTFTQRWAWAGSDKFVVFVLSL